MLQTCFSCNSRQPLSAEAGQVEPVWVKVLDGVGFAFWMALAFRVMTANTFISTFVPIQDDNGHTTLTRGPYRWVRHPMCLGVIVLMLGIPLVLGSYWALVPGGLIGVLFIVRTALEDKFLQSDLLGYLDNTRQVCYRLVPGVW